MTKTTHQARQFKYQFEISERELEIASDRLIISERSLQTAESIYTEAVRFHKQCKETVEWIHEIRKSGKKPKHAS